MGIRLTSECAKFRKFEIQIIVNQWFVFDEVALSTLLDSFWIV